MNDHRGRGAQLNPDNRFSSTMMAYDPDGIDDYEPSEIKTEFFEERPRSIVSINDSPDLKMMNSINPYQGCEHGCIYCFARPTHEYWGFNAGLDFESKIVVKRNAAEVLVRTFLKSNWKVSTIMLSGNTDCYQPVERKLKITRSLLEVFVKYRHPIAILTKNSLIERDFDLIQQLNQHGLVHVYFSITTLDESLRRKMEPRTSTTANKLRLIEKLSEMKVPVGVMTAPIIPGLNHQEIPELLRQTADAGSLAAGYTVVRLNGPNGNLMKDWLTRNFPDRKDKVLNQIKELHGGEVNDSEFGRRIIGAGAISDVIRDLFDVSCRKYYAGRVMPEINKSAFRRNGHYLLFGDTQ